jgi:hypothetical protein
MLYVVLSHSVGYNYVYFDSDECFLPLLISILIIAMSVCFSAESHSVNCCSVECHLSERRNASFYKVLALFKSLLKKPSLIFFLRSNKRKFKMFNC